jgi:hypothetical protein
MWKYMLADVQVKTKRKKLHNLHQIGANGKTAT